MFTLTFDTLNAAFDDGDDGATETARILRAVAESIDAGNRTGSARDTNGNRVGAFDLDAADATPRETQLAAALEKVGALLTDWPTVRALSAYGAAVATEKKLAARAIIAAALATA